MLGRQVAAALRRPLQARLRTTTAAPQTQHTLCIRTFSHAPRQLFPAGRPKKAVGEPSKPIKRAVKKDAKKPATEADAAAKKVRTAEAAAKKKAAAAKQAKEQRLANRTPEQIAKHKAKLDRAEVSELTKAALKAPPVNARASAWTTFLREKSPELKEAIAEHPREHKSNDNGPTSQRARDAVAVFSKEMSEQFKNLTASEREHYNHLANANKEAVHAAYKSWVESHTVDQIDVANAARAKLRRLNAVKNPQAAGKRNPPSKWPAIRDERRIKGPRTAFMLFNVNRWASGDLKAISVRESGPLLSKEWKLLDEGEKKKWFDIAKQDHERWVSEYTSVYGRPPKAVADA